MLVYKDGKYIKNNAEWLRDNYPTLYFNRIFPMVAGSIPITPFYNWVCQEDLKEHTKMEEKS